jgi:predicted nuclease of predicted toxin-antitoxin system
VKIIFDQNISFRVSNQLKDLYPGCAQIRELGLENKTDRDIWDFSKREGFTIATFDADFYDLVTLFGHPPKVIWLRMGNTKSENLIAVLREHYEIIKLFITDEKYDKIGCLELN